MTKCNSCQKVSNCIECWLCTDHLCEWCDKGLHEMMDLGAGAILECSSCVLAFTPEGNIHWLVMKHLQRKESSHV